MEISGSCSSSHLAAAQREFAPMPTLKCRAWSHGGPGRRRRAAQRPQEPHGEQLVRAQRLIGITCGALQLRGETLVFCCFFF